MGQAGILLTIVIILVAKSATTLTTLSMNAIATNGQVQAGGPYYIISRNLGVEVRKGRKKLPWSVFVVRLLFLGSWCTSCSVEGSLLICCLTLTRMDQTQVLGWSNS